MTKNSTQQHLPKSGGSVVKSSFVLLSKFLLGWQWIASKSPPSGSCKTLAASGFEHSTNKINLMKTDSFIDYFDIWNDTFFHGQMTIKYELCAKTILQTWRNDKWRQDAIKVADICKRMFRLLDVFFQTLFFWVYGHKIHWRKKSVLRKLSRKLFKTDNLPADKWVVWEVNWSFMTTDYFSATVRQTRTRSGRMNVQKLHQQPTARFR